MVKVKMKKHYKFSIYIEILYRCYIIQGIMDMEKHIYVVSEDIIIYEHSGVLPTLWTLECGTRRYMNTYASFFSRNFLWSYKHFKIHGYVERTVYNRYVFSYSHILSI